MIVTFADPTIINSLVDLLKGAYSFQGPIRAAHEPIERITWLNHVEACLVVRQDVYEQFCCQA